MKRLYKKLAAYTKRLRTQLFLAYFLLFALFFVAIAALVTLGFRGLLVEQIGASRMDVLRQIAERANTVKTSSVTLSNLYSYEILAQDMLSEEQTAGQRSQARIYLNEQKRMYDDVFSRVGLGYEVTLLGENGFFYTSDAGGPDAQTLGQQLWYRRLLTNLREADTGEVQFSRTFESAQKDGHYQFAAGRLLGGGPDKSVLLVVIDEQLLENLYTSVQNEEGEIYIYDQDGFIVSHPNKKMLGKQFIDVGYMERAYGRNSSAIVTKRAQDYLLTTYLDDATGWTIVEEIPTRVPFAALNRVYLLVACLLAAGLVLAIVLALYMSRRVARPLTQLSAAMGEFGGRENFRPLPADTGTQEIDSLRESFNHMAVEIFHLMDAVQEREQQKRVLEMNFLRAQINPHFLYNMLFSIRCTVEIGKNEQAAQMIDAFSDLLRSTLAVKDSTIPLRDELESTRKYLVVQKLRYGEKVHYEIDMQEGSERCMVPALILQPLVENAIFHGLEAKEDADMIVIASTLKDGELLLSVTDDGAGIDREKLEQVRARYSRPRVRGASSIGMANVHNRIRLNYGEGYGLFVESAPGIGTTATLRMPAIFGQEENDESSDRG